MSKDKVESISEKLEMNLDKIRTTKDRIETITVDMKSTVL
jgi:hypothetical protein